MNSHHEPPIDPMADTNPTITIRPDGEGQRHPAQTIIGWVSVLGAVVLTVGAIVLLIAPQPAPAPPEQESDVIAQVVTPSEDVPDAVEAPDTSDASTAIPTEAPTEEAPVEVTLPDVASPPAIPTVNVERLNSLLLTPIAPQGDESIFYDPFTIIPDRPRSEFVEYVIVRGDTIDAIARRYNLRPESIAWCNDRRIIQTIRPGDVLRIPPVDGACHAILATRNQTIADIAAEYKIDDPYQVIDSPYNPMLFGRSPDDVLPGGATLFLPGGEGELITWNPGSEIERNADGTVRTVSFAPGQAGSCGAVEPGGGAFWANPLPSGRWVRGFYAGHTGIDLAAPTGTPIYAANSGPVLFSGFSRWGYGETVVLGHGPFSTLYAHMHTRNVSCGQFVTVGQVIGFVGSTGNSSGPHLHFEIRFNDVPQDPTTTPGIGW